MQGMPGGRQLIPEVVLRLIKLIEKGVAKEILFT